MFIQGRNAANPAQRLAEAAIGDTAPLPDGYLKVRDVAMHELGVGTTHDMKSVFPGMFMQSLLHREYTLGEKINLWRGKLFSGSQLWNTQLSTDLTQKLTRLDVPASAREGLLHLQAVGPRAVLRGTAKNARDHAIGRVEGIDGSG